MKKMNKLVGSGLLVLGVLLTTAPVLAETNSADKTVSAVKQEQKEQKVKYDQAVLKAAKDKMVQTTKAANEAYQTALKAAGSQLKTDLAKAKADKSKDEVKTARTNYKTAVKAAKTAKQTALKAARDQFKTDKDAAVIK